MCLSIAVDRPNDVLEKGEHAGHEYVIVHNGSGYRCGYVKVGKDHPWHGKDHDDLDVNVHGGLTFANPDKPCGKGGADDGFWFGFDCAHGGDAPDPSLPNEMPLSAIFLLSSYGTVKDTDYVRAECFRLCEQAAEAAVPFAEAA